MKRLLITTLILSFLITVNVSASSIALSSTGSVKVGNTITATFNTGLSDKITNFSGTIIFNGAVLTCDGASAGSVKFSTASSSYNLTFKAIAEGKSSIALSNCTVTTSDNKVVNVDASSVVIKVEAAQAVTEQVTTAEPQSETVAETETQAETEVQSETVIQEETTVVTETTTTEETSKANSDDKRLFGLDIDGDTYVYVCAVSIVLNILLFLAFLFYFKSYRALNKDLDEMEADLIKKDKECYELKLAKEELEALKEKIKKAKEKYKNNQQ